MPHKGQQLSRRRCRRCRLHKIKVKETTLSSLYFPLISPLVLPGRPKLASREMPALHRRWACVFRQFNHVGGKAGRCKAIARTTFRTLLLQGTFFESCHLSQWERFASSRLERAPQLRARRPCGSRPSLVASRSGPKRRL